MARRDHTTDDRGRRKLLAAAAGVAVAAAVAASAASLGGLSVDRIGAEDAVVLDPTAGLTLEWGPAGYDPGTGRYVVSELTLVSRSADVALPAVADGATVKVALLDQAGTVLAESDAVDGGGDEYQVSFASAIDIEAVATASVVVAE